MSHWFFDRFRFSIASLVRRFGIPTHGVLHVGANFGQEADVYDRLGFQTVIWVEGYVPYFEELVKAVGARPNHQALCSMVSDIEGEMVSFSIASNTGSSTALKTTQSWQDTFQGITLSDGGVVRCRRLDHVLEEALPAAERERLRFLVLDIEGSELKALRSLGSHIDRIDFALVEVSFRPNFEGGPLLHDIDRFFISHGFRRAYLKASASSGDALYQRMGAIPAFGAAAMRLSALGWRAAATLRITDASVRLRNLAKRVVRQ